ncbi:hypothetical protein J6500_13635 [Bradyrhizobium sp. WSM 1704]|uniref:hypothetical protein n=1 Tax=Bradyrhizobium semiaridum TaxID=2821404 RepID=UPI001CE256A7|nr:hypothetical protein [Bradyrhizobium semiaridum]MCA6122931.1 hypothetical protein [Bradyrhizobium semiaridum]
MVRAVLMTNEQIAELVRMARRDEVLWASLKDREVNQLHEDGSAKLPSISMLVEDFVGARYGALHTFDTGSLITELRRAARRELGLSI